MDNGSVAWETALVDDLLPAIDARFRTIQGRAGRAIAGLSMGGYGAMHLALRHPDQFAAVASLSGALYSPDDPLTDDDIADFHGAFGDPFDPDLFARQSVYTDLSELPSDATPPRVYLASGGRDQYGFDVSAMRLYQALKEHNVPPLWWSVPITITAGSSGTTTWAPSCPSPALPCRWQPKRAPRGHPPAPLSRRLGTPGSSVHLNESGAMTMTRPDGPEPVLIAVLAVMNMLLVTTAFLRFLM